MAYNYYKLLGVPHTATDEEIKVAYRKLAKQYHPDICEAPRSKEAFQVLNTSYKVLMHPQKRKAYDATLGLMQRTGMSAERAKGAARAMHFTQHRSPHAPHIPIPKELPKMAVKFLFMYGIFIGIVMLFMTASLILSSLWPLWMGWMGFIGLILIADGTQGLITNSESLLLKLGNKVRKLYS